MRMGAVMLNTVQAGRTAAAIAVAANHLSIGMGKPQYGGDAVFEVFTRFGNLGVDFFFVLSGFIILHAHEKDIGHPERVARYVRKRIIRLYPIYFLYSSIFVGLVLLGVGEVVLPSFAVDWVSIVSLVRFSDTAAPIRVAWTLFHEVAFYAAFAVIVVWPRIGLTLFAIWMAVCFVELDYPTEDSRTPWATYTAAWNLNFALGMIAYKVHKTLQYGRLLMVGGAALSGIAVAMAYPGWPFYQLLFAIGTGLLLSGLATRERLGQLTVPFWAALAGNASYTIYLTHSHIQGVALKIYNRLPFDLAPQLAFVAILVLSVAVGVGLYLLIEKPLLATVRQIWSREATPAPTA